MSQQQGSGPINFVRTHIPLTIAVVIVLAAVVVFLATRSAGADEEPTATPSVSSTAQLDSPSAPASTTPAASPSDAPEAAEEPSEPASSPEPTQTTATVPEDLGDAIRAPEESKWDYAAEAFTAAWANPSVGKEEWLKAMEPWATEELMTGFGYTDIRLVAQTDEVSVSLSEEVGQHRSFLAYDEVNGGPLFEGVATRGSDGAWKVSKVGPPPKG